MKFNHLFIILIATVVGTAAWLPSHAQQQPGQPQQRMQPKLEGVWQLVYPQEVEGKVEWHIQPCLKIIATDGTYNNVFIRVTEGGSSIGETGTFQKISDSTFTQKVNYSIDSTRMGSQLDVTFKLKGRNWLVTEFQTKEGKTNEIWMRVAVRRQGGQGGQGEGQRMAPNGRQGQQGGNRSQQQQRKRSSSSTQQTNPFQQEIQSAQQSIQDDEN